MLEIPGYLFLILLSGCLNANDVNKIDEWIHCIQQNSHLLEIKINGCVFVSDTHQNLQQQCDLQNRSLELWTIGEIADLKACVQMDCHERKKAVLMECVKKAIGSWVEKGMPVVNKTQCIRCKIDCKASDCNAMKIEVCKSTDESRDVKKTTKTTYLSTKELQNQTTKISQYQETTAAKDTTKYTREITTLNKLEQTVEDASYTITPRDEMSSLEKDVKNLNAMVAIYCLSVLVILLSLLVLFLLYLRCSHQKRQNLKNMSGVPNNDQPENMAKNTGVYELADNSKLEAMEGDTKVPMTGTKEDVYNHLWEKPAEKENVYNKCTLERNETSVYDVSGGPKCISATVNANYDHVTLGNANLDTPI